MKYLITLVMTSLLYTSTNAATYTGTFKPYWYNDSMYIRMISVTTENPASCMKRGLLQLQEAPSNEIFKYKYSMLLSAWMANKSIKLVGTGECTWQGDEKIYAVNY
jgi:hypothetical protein